ncbi:Serine/threonine-protein phosphatase 2A activator 1 [Lachnellula cervina]|uniref:Serine/threonine-protein phosphatase 2A activator n=1 Tax=Lachnellula cervina TaxID=1316786 RepID=A0A7D8YSX4_9HELO|nr:Serine/threonine-protein phosphatase 2A activator 1 [Lachnellula cervina]
MEPQLRNNDLQSQASSISLPVLDMSQPHTFLKPAKRINEGHDVPAFLTSRAYSDIGVFIMQLNIAMCPRKSSESGGTRTWQLDGTNVLSGPVQQLRELLQKIDSIIEEAPPDTGPRRFGNVSFRKWYEILESRVQALLETHLPRAVLDVSASSDGTSVLEELTPYLLGGFGSAQRLDYGTGHELSFLAFLGCIWKLGGFSTEKSQDGELERSLVLGVIEPYLRVVRRLILTYTLEPAGSHGVWGLDDHSFLPYILGSSQYCPAISEGDSMPVEGALPGAPNPGDIAKKNVVERERKHNMYFSAVGFINDVKTGPFWEHSPILFDISGVRSGWGKINKGMIKMYNAEVLSKFPVVQHFPFGSLFSWEQDPNALPVSASVHTASQPTSHPPSINATTSRPSQATRAPWADSKGGGEGPTPAPWSQKHPAPPQTGLPPTRAPWATSAAGQLPVRSERNSGMPPPPPDGPTKAPWLNQR